MSNLLHTLADFFFPRLCPVCGNRLLEQEEHLCLYCLQHLPVTHYHTRRDNPLEQLFWGRLRIERAVALFHYLPDSPYRRLIHRMKYRGDFHLAEAVAFHYGKVLKEAGIFDSVTAIVPVPLHAHRERTRGYNQSEAIARGISKALQCPVRTDLLRRIRDNETQTGKARYDRWRNTHELFEAIGEPLSKEAHLLLIDDVITTGATMIACGEALREQSPECRISILSLAATDESQ